MRPVNDTGWYAMPLTTWMFSIANWRILPTCRSFTPRMIVGTRKTFIPAAWMLASARRFTSRSGRPRVARCTSSSTPSNWR